MCGIAGVWDERHPEALSAAVERMVARQRHRGPDEQRVVAFAAGTGTLVLGFDRLAILDLGPDASQPMAHEASGSWLVFNGEIYNFRALRERLETAGHRFRSSGDTEVLLAALVEWGEGALPRLRGMYAFAFWDGRRRRLLLGRDPFGMKPLLYARQGSGFVFASELRAIAAADLAPLVVDHDALEGYLAYGAVPEPCTIAHGVRALPPGHVLDVVPGRPDATPRRVLALADLLGTRGAADPARPDEAVAEVERTLADSVAAHLVADVPLGVLLSGGVDSTLVARLAARAGAAPTFLTVGSEGTGASEVAAARVTAARLGGRHEVVPVTAADVLALLPAALDAMDQPTADGLNTFVVTRAAACHGIRVLVSGLGGDEVFGGYTSFTKAPLLAARSAWLAPIGRALAALGWGNTAQWAKIAGADGVRDVRAAYVLQRALGCGISADGGRYRLPVAAWDALAAPGAPSSYQHVSFLELSFYLRNQLLRDADIFSSANAVELRVPFVDLEVLREAWRLPAAAHLGRLGVRKRVLRGMLRRLDPAAAVGRVKRGFAFPWSAWLRGPLDERVTATLADAGAHLALGLEPRSGLRLSEAFRRADPRVGWAEVWSRFVLLEWQRRVPLSVGQG